MGRVRLKRDIPWMEDEAASAAATTNTLVCIECEVESSPAACGWRAYRFETEVLIYCPGCASREFDESD